jgi:hypothetical protein
MAPDFSHSIATATSVGPHRSTPPFIVSLRRGSGAHKPKQQRAPMDGWIDRIKSGSISSIAQD